jgi:YihY family inner membrane protein
VIEELRSSLINLVRLSRAAVAAFHADGGRALSAALVYYSTLSTVPLAILVISLPGLMLRFVSREASERFLRTVEELAGPTIGEIITSFLYQVENQSLVVAGVSLAMLIFSASTGFRYLRYAFRWIWREELSEDDLSRSARMRKTLLGRTIDYLIAFGMVFAAPFIVTLGILIYVLILFTRQFFDDLPLIGEALGSLLTPTFLLLLYAVIYILLLWVMPPIRLRLREIWLPGLLCALAVLVTTYGLALYIRFFSLTSLYGAIGTIFTLQLWTFVNAIILFNAAELCKLLVRERGEIRSVNIQARLEV